MGIKQITVVVREEYTCDLSGEKVEPSEARVLQPGPMHRVVRPVVVAHASLAKLPAIFSQNDDLLWLLSESLLPRSKEDSKDRFRGIIFTAKVWVLNSREVIFDYAGSVRANKYQTAKDALIDIEEMAKSNSHFGTIDWHIFADGQYVTTAVTQTKTVTEVKITMHNTPPTRD